MLKLKLKFKNYKNVNIKQWAYKNLTQGGTNLVNYHEKAKRMGKNPTRPVNKVL